MPKTEHKRVKEEFFLHNIVQKLSLMQEDRNTFETVNPTCSKVTANRNFSGEHG